MFAHPYSRPLAATLLHQFSLPPCRCHIIRLVLKPCFLNAILLHSVNGEALYTGYGSPGVRLWVNWGTDPVVPPAGFDMEAYTAIPQLNDPAFEQRLQGEHLGGGLSA